MHTREVNRRLGEAYGLLGDWDNSITAYRAALRQSNNGGEIVGGVLSGNMWSADEAWSCHVPVELSRAQAEYGLMLLKRAEWGSKQLAAYVQMDIDGGAEQLRKLQEPMYFEALTELRLAVVTGIDAAPLYILETAMTERVCSAIVSNTQS